MKSGATFSFPPALAQGLAAASPEDLAKVEVTPSGDGLHDREAGCGFECYSAFGRCVWHGGVDGSG
ncbi:MAG: DUF2442 domain-containing protein [Coleofasciculus sp.]